MRPSVPSSAALPRKTPCASLPTRRPEQVSSKERIRSHWVSVIGGRPRENTPRVAGREANRGRAGCPRNGASGGSNQGSAWPPATTHTRNGAGIFRTWRRLGSGCNPKPIRPKPLAPQDAQSISTLPNAGHERVPVVSLGRMSGLNCPDAVFHHDNGYYGPYVIGAVGFPARQHSFPMKTDVALGRERSVRRIVFQRPFNLAFVCVPDGQAAILPQAMLPRPKVSGLISIGRACNGIQAVLVLPLLMRPVMRIGMPQRGTAVRFREPSLSRVCNRTLATGSKANRGARQNARMRSSRSACKNAWPYVLRFSQTGCQAGCARTSPRNPEPSACQPRRGKDRRQFEATLQPYA